jgi:DNA-binding IclR family transcriptional regulator
MIEDNDKYRAPALDKGLDIMELLSSQGEGLSQKEVAVALSRSQGEIYRMLSTLVRRDYVTYSTSADRYTLSLKMFSVSQKHPPINRLIGIALPMMRRASRTTWQSCHIGMESNGNIVIVASVESPGNWSVALKTGSVVGLWNTGTGRVLSTYCPEAQREDLINHHRQVTGEPKLIRSEFDDHIKRIKRVGFEYMPSATAVGITNIAFPIFNPAGIAFAVLSCPFVERLDDVEVPSQDATIKIFSHLAKELTTFYCGR